MSGSSNEQHVVAGVDEIVDGERVVTQIKGREIAVFKLKGEYYAYLNWCAHQGGPCGEGSLTGTRIANWVEEDSEVKTNWEQEDEILNCPWHGWEYDLRTGDCLSRQDVTLPSYPVKIVDEEIVVTL